MEEGAVIKHDLKKAPQTGNWSFMRPEVSAEKCIGCGICVPYCPEAAIELTTGNKQPTTPNRKIASVDHDFCKGCGVCADVCPQKAITMRKK